MNRQLGPAVEWLPRPSSPRTRLSRTLSLIAFEHGSGALELVRAGKYTSATGLLRLQYEAFVRSVWLNYSASDAQVERLSDERRVASNEKLPALREMLDALRDVAPDTLVAGMVEFHESSWKPLSSYIHGGIHAARWVNRGFPDPLLVQLVRICNGLLVYTALHLADLSGDRSNGLRVVTAAKRCPGCVPPRSGEAGAV